jgi:hypothetical protein
VLRAKAALPFRKPGEAACRRFLIAILQNQKAVGTRSFWSVRLHQGAAQSYRDDLEALAYCLIWFLTGNLPWSAALDFNAMVQKKLKSSIEQICHNVPAEFQRFLQERKPWPIALT